MITLGIYIGINMTLRQFVIDFSTIGEDEYLRNDVKYHYMLNTSHWNLYDGNIAEQIRLDDVLLDSYNNFIFQEDGEYKGVPTGRSYIDEDGYITDFIKISMADHPNRLKYQIKNNHLLISSLRLAKSPALFFETGDLSDYVFSNGFYIYKVKEGWNIKFVLYLLRTKRLKNLLDNHLYRGIGISAYKDTDLKKIRIPFIQKEIQDLIVAQIDPVEKKLIELKSKIKPHQVIIDEVLTREFNFDIDHFIELSKTKIYTASFSDYSDNIDLRYSVKFHRTAGAFVLHELLRLTSKKIKHFLAEPIVLGSSISPSDYDENGEYYYVSMANIRNWEFENYDALLVSTSYSQINQAKTVSKNDIIVARSGEGTIGKVALITDEDLLGVFADFTMRVRLTKYNPTFAYYYFRTTYFQYLIEIHKKGLGNNTNIFPSQIQEFPLIDLPLTRQGQLVAEIQSELDQQESIRIAIEQERVKIDRLIEYAIL